ncbi:hypothetical protein L0936_19490 [Paracidovorax citrulli]
MNMTDTEQRSPDSENPVASFEVGIITVEGKWVGICIKFSMFDHSTRITHWSSPAYRRLIDGLNEYYGLIGAQALMFKAADNPELVKTLPPRHPYHTVVNEKPSLTEQEIGTATIASRIDRTELVARGTTLELRPKWGDGHNESLYLHEYVALSLLVYLDEYMDAARRLTGPAAGNA